MTARARPISVAAAGFMTFVMGYVGLSLFDPWARFAPLVHVLAFVLLLALGIHAIVSVLRPRQGAASFPWVRLALFGPLLLLGVYSAGGDAARRIYVAFTPAYITPDSVMRLDVTITPPAYTGLKPVILARQVETPLPAVEEEKPVTVPAGSVINVKAEGKGFQPSLVWGRSAIALRSLGQDKFGIAGKIEADTQVEIRQGSKRLAVWPLTVVADRPPRVQLVNAPRFTERQSLKLSVRAVDDYGVSYLGLKINLKGDTASPPKLVDLPAYGTREVSEVQYANLLSHPWAGRAVTARLVAVDGDGQVGESAAFDLTLPQARFQNPLSQSLVLVRRNILEGGNGVKLAVQRLGSILAVPDQSMLDVTTYLGLRTAYTRLGADSGGEHTGEIASLLWDLAVRSEDGGLTNARDDLAQVLDQLRFAVRKKASADDVNALVGRFAWALRSYDDNRRKAGVRVAATGAGALRAEDVEEGLDWPALTSFLNKMVDQASRGDYARVAAGLDAFREGLEERGDLLLSAGVYRRFLIAGLVRQKLADIKDGQERLMFVSQQPGSVEGPLRQRMLSSQRELRTALLAVSRQLERAGLDYGPVDAAARAMNEALAAGARNDFVKAARVQGQSLAALQQAVSFLAQVPSPVGKDWAGGTEDPLGRPLPGFMPLVNGDAHSVKAAENKGEKAEPGQSRR